jgi:hypothetical protein
MVKILVGGLCHTLCYFVGCERHSKKLRTENQALWLLNVFAVTICECNSKFGTSAMEAGIPNQDLSGY